MNLPYQQVNHLKIINSSKYVWDRLKLETDVSLQWNYRQEWSQYVDHGYMPAVFPDTMGFDPELERQFDKYVYSGNLKISYDVGDKTQFRFGTNGEYHDNRVEGRAFLIPAFRQLNLGAYVLGKHSVTPTSIIQYGLRYDFGNIHTRERFDWFPSPVIMNSDTISQHLQRAGDLNLNFSNLSWSLGYNLNLKKWSFKSNIGRSFRMPIAKELAANGVNYHHFSYEIGNADLLPEISYQLDAGMEFTSRKFAAELTPFVNYFQNYIYLNPTSEYDRLHGNGNQVYYYTQSQVLRYGVEIHAHYQLWKFLQLGVIGEYVYSEQLSGEKKGYTLPFSPPASGILNLKYMQPKIRFAEKVYASVDFIFTAPQNQIVPPEENTEGYFLINVGWGGNLKIKNQALNISFRVQNLLNNKYFNHTSYYRLINVPEPGRNFILNLSIPVTGKIKQKDFRQTTKNK
jgi:iron complex outermembrane recepter protein